MAGGTIVTFYSYKGGTGRSMSLANVAWILASNGLRVLTVDWDLEGPGLHRYFHPFLPDEGLRTSPGVIDMMWEFANAAMDPQAPAGPDWHVEFAHISPYAMSIDHDFPGQGTIDLVPAGRQDASYSALVSSFDWDNFYDRLGGGGFLESLKHDMRSRYDYVLIDSRTGLSDTAGICTVQLPDLLVACYSMSTQAIDGSAAVAASVEHHRTDDDLRILPVPMRVENGEHEKLESSRDYARHKFDRFLWHVDDLDRYWGQVEVPYRTYYAYEEILATIGDRPRQENTVLAATERLVGYLTNGRITHSVPVGSETARRELLARFQRTTTTTPARALQRRPSNKVFVFYTVDSPQHVAQVRELLALLRASGIDARLDRDLEQWDAQTADQRDFAVLVVVEPSQLSAHEYFRRDPVHVAELAVHAVSVSLPGAGRPSTMPFPHIDVDELSIEGIATLVRLVSRPPRVNEIGGNVQGGIAIGHIDGAVTVVPRLQRQLAEAADQVAQAVSVLCRRAEESQRIQDPFPLPVRWQSAIGPVTDHWANIAHAPAGESSGPVSLTGRLDNVVNVYRRIPSGRLVVLGTPGSGKTILTLRFVLDLVKTRASGDPVPVTFGLGSWNPITTSFGAWLTGRLVQDHPGLATAGPDGSALAAALVDAGLILPVLDGFDEVADGLRGAALKALNATELPLLLTSRPAEYDAAVAGTDVLTAAAVVELAGLTLTDLIDYLPRTTRRITAHSAATVWDPVLAVLRNEPDSPASSNLMAVLTNPQMVALARAIYSDSVRHDPAELLDTARFSTPEALEGHLLDNFIPTVYEGPPDQRRSGYIQPDRVQHWLAYLAQHLDQLDTRDLAWWRLSGTMRRASRMLVLGLMSGLLFGLLSGLLAGLAGRPTDPVVDGLTVGLFGLMAVLSGGGTVLKPSRVQLRIVGRTMSSRANRLRRLVKGLGVGLLAGGGGGLAFIPISGLASGLSAEIDGGLVGLLVGLVFGLVAWLETPLDLRSAVSPAGLLKTSRTTAILQMLGVGLVTGIGDGLLFGLFYGLMAGFVAGVGGGVVFGLAYGLSMTVWGQWLIFARIWLPLTGRLPWRLLAFLNDAHQRGVLRQDGAFYQFRHARLQGHLEGDD